ncbi:MAG: hypothetical protein V3U65_03345 [Granulosicoccaceae bacterium]
MAISKNALLLAACFMTGCSGGGTTPNTNANPANNSTGSTDTTTGNPAGNSSNYPKMFQTFDNFQTGLGFPVDRTSDIFVLEVLVPLLSQELLKSQLIGENTLLQRSHCEKGSASAIGFYEYDAGEPTYTSADGSISFITSSGITAEQINVPEEGCTYSAFYDGNIIFDIDRFEDDVSDTGTSLITATLGSSGAPLFVEASGDGSFDGVLAYTGTYSSNSSRTSSTSNLALSTPSMEIFTVDSSASEPYLKNGYLKDDYTSYKNYTQEITTTGEDTNNKITSITHSYDQQFEEDGEQYLLQVTKSAIRKFGVDSLTTSESYNLVVAGDNSKTVVGTKIQESTDTKLSYTHTLTKDGITETDTQSVGN